MSDWPAVVGIALGFWEGAIAIMLAFWAIIRDVLMLWSAAWFLTAAISWGEPTPKETEEGKKNHMPVNLN